MKVYRIASGKYIDDLSGAGAKQYGGRWNEKGITVVYFASSRAMAIMEVLVHLRPEDLARDFVLATFEVPEDKILTITVDELPRDWKDEVKAYKLKQKGKSFVEEGKHLLMRVPSVLVEEEANLILNPAHGDAKNVKLIVQRPFRFDHRFKY